MPYLPDPNERPTPLQIFAELALGLILISAGLYIGFYALVASYWIFQNVRFGLILAVATSGSFIPIGGCLVWLGTVWVRVGLKGEFLPE